MTEVREKHKMQDENAERERERDYGIRQNGREAVDLLTWKIRHEAGWGLHSLLKT